MIRSDPNYAVSFLFRKAIHPRSRKAARVLLFAPKKQVYIDTGDGSFVLKKHISDHVQKLLTGFAAGVVVAASFWSLLAPALESSEAMGTWSFVPAAVGFLVGVGFLLLLDEVTPHLHFNNQEEGPRSGLKRTTKLILAVTLHNIPEGMAVGVVYAGFRSGNAGISAFRGAIDTKLQLKSTDFNWSLV